MEAGATQQVAAQQSTTELGTPPVALLPWHLALRKKEPLGTGVVIIIENLSGREKTLLSALAKRESHRNPKT